MNEPTTLQEKIGQLLLVGFRGCQPDECALIARDLRVSHVAIDRAHISDDSGTWFPLPALRRALQRHARGLHAGRRARGRRTHAQARRRARRRATAWL